MDVAASELAASCSSTFLYVHRVCQGFRHNYFFPPRLVAMILIEWWLTAGSTHFTGGHSQILNRGQGPQGRRQRDVYLLKLIHIIVTDTSFKLDLSEEHWIGRFTFFEAFISVMCDSMKENPLSLNLCIMAAATGICHVLTLHTTSSARLSCYSIHN